MSQFRYTHEQLPQAARWLLSEARDTAVWLFEGEMGAGKTTLIKAVCEQLGVQSTVQSPTFSIVNEYQTNTRQAVYHFDCYRLKNETEAMDIGIEEYFASGERCFVEWPYRIPNLLPQRYAVLQISVIDPLTRIIHLAQYPA
jgi:tRNA threonylcarbamoyladenosine biosynthesis protein TsaE